ncbi:unnamed protein product [Brachionus calyciflorus]|uniref:DUF4773 domain-containing protein n=1 Tax=Brachionus calyciflorus TaxID=104777 RepID=A0A813PME0_9BILA|nr:unnamed protein product [Brachionus calyciflorus]
MNFKIYLLVVASVFLKTEAFIIYPFNLISRPFDLKESLFNWNIYQVQNQSAFEESNEINSNETYVKRNYAYGCKCEERSCVCCSHIEIERIKLNQTGCLVMNYTNLDNLELTFKLDDKVLYNRSISLANPPDLCFATPIPLVNFCLKFYQIDARNKSLSGSVDLIVKLDGVKIARIKLGTFHFGKKTFFQQNSIMTVYLNKNNSIFEYANEMNNLEQFNMAAKNLISNTYEKFVNDFEKLPSLPKISMNFQPDTFFKSFFRSFFGSENTKNSSQECDHSLFQQQRSQTQQDDKDHLFSEHEDHIVYKTRNYNLTVKRRTIFSKNSNRNYCLLYSKTKAFK